MEEEEECGGGIMYPLQVDCLCAVFLCHARPGNRPGGQQMCLLGGPGVQGITEYWFSVLILYM